MGIDLRIDEVPAETYFEDFVTVLSTPFQGGYFINRPASVIASTFTGTRSSSTPRCPASRAWG